MSVHLLKRLHTGGELTTITGRPRPDGNSVQPLEPMAGSEREQPMLFVVSKRERFLSQILHSDQLTDVEKANAVASLIEGERSVKDAMRWLVTQQSQSAAMEGLTPRQRTSTQIVAVILAKGENPFNNETRKQYGLAALW